MEVRRSWRSSSLWGALGNGSGSGKKTGLAGTCPRVHMGGTALRRLKSALVVAVAAATLASVGVATNPVDAQTRGKKDLYVIGVYEIKGESPLGISNFDDGAKLAVKELEKKGWTVQYERIPASATAAASQEQAWLQVQQKQPDAWMGMGSSGVFIPVGPKVAATDQP